MKDLPATKKSVILFVDCRADFRHLEKYLSKEIMGYSKDKVEDPLTLACRWIFILTSKDMVNKLMTLLQLP